MDTTLNTPADTTALQALQAAMCATSGECNNDVELLLASNAYTFADWQRAVANQNALNEMVRCTNLRDKMIALGADITAFDAMMDSIDGGSVFTDALMTHVGQAGL